MAATKKYKTFRPLPGSALDGCQLPCRTAIGHDHGCALLWREGDVAAADLLRRRAGLVQLAAAEDLAQHDPHLELGEGGADAAAGAAGEGNARVGVGAR